MREVVWPEGSCESGDTICESVELLELGIVELCDPVSPVEEGNGGRDAPASASPGAQ
jgi:hypothetical protein